MKLKRNISILLCILLLLFAVSACSDTAETSQTSGSSSTTGTSSAVGTSSTPTDSSTTDSTPSQEPSTEESTPSEEPSTEESTPSQDESNDPEQEEPEVKTYKHVIVIGVDGAGRFFRQAQTPNIDRIFKDGAITYDMLTSNPTISAQCWGSMLHGVTPVHHGLTNAIAETVKYPTDSLFPSFFRVIRENDPDAVLASFSHWNPINYGIIEDGIGVHKVGGLADEALTNEICKYLQNNAPTAMFIQFDEADGAGHSTGYGTAAQLQTIARIDGYIGRIYDAYKEKGILDETLFIVTADHGGNGTSHGGWTDGEKYVMFAAVGKTVTPGTIGEMEVRDTAAIVLHALGYEVPETWTAKVPDNLFDGVEGQVRPVYSDPTSDRYHESVPTPKEGTDDYITSFIKNHKLTAYLPFDGDIKDRMGATTKQDGKLYFVDGYFGQGVSLDDGCVAIRDYAPGKDSFTASLWFHTEGVGVDPVLFSNKDWNNGYNKGYVLSIRNVGDIRFNMGDGSGRMDANAILPTDYRTGWVHILLVVDRTKQEIRMCYDFGAVITAPIPASLQDDSLNAFDSLFIGQDGTGKYPVKLSATVDEFMLFDGAFDREDIDALAAYYGVEHENSLRAPVNQETPKKGSDSYITSVISDLSMKAYLTFDGNADVAAGDATSATHGKLSYTEGVFGKAASFSDGYVSLQNCMTGKESFSVAMWVKAGQIGVDPLLLSNKDWVKGTNKGFAFSLRNTHDVKFNFGDGSKRMDGEYLLPTDYQTGWVYVILVVDREAGEIRCSTDFGKFTVTKIPDTLKNAPIDSYQAWNIGQDGTGNYSVPLKAAIDEFMLFDGVLTNQHLAQLKEYFGL